MARAIAYYLEVDEPALRREIVRLEENADEYELELAEVKASNSELEAKNAALLAELAKLRGEAPGRAAQ